MKKIFLATLLCTLTFGCAFAQKKNVNAGVTDPKANGILDKASQKLKSAGAVSFDVTLVEKNSAKKETARQKARVVFSGNKYRLTFDNMLVLCNGTAVYQVDNDVKEVTINKI